jgi:RNA polymerase sigma-70 factor (ECF subfamily)
MTPSAASQTVRSGAVPMHPCPAPIRSAPSGPDRLLCSSARRVLCLFDEAYLGALRARDPHTEASLISHFSRPVQVKLRARLRSPELIQDAFQETFLRVLTYFRSGKTLDNPASLPGFVYVTCHNVALELLRGHTRHDQFPEQFREPIAAGLDPERQVVTEERKALVRRLLEELSEKDRKLIKRVFLDEEDKDAVCREFDVNRNYLRVLLHRARVRFKAVISHDSAKRAAEG